MLRAAGGAAGLAEGTLFGLAGPLQEIDDFFAAAAQRLELRRRILLLLGPVGGGKSTFVELMKRGLERFSQSEQGALYAIAGCPMREEPLHLVPQGLRAEVSRDLGVAIEGELCPACQQRVGRLRPEEVLEVEVEHVHLSEQRRAGIGTFAPSDPKSQDIAELTGSLDLSTIAAYGVESDPRAFRFDGELNVASRGLMEFVELLKCDERFLYTLLTLAQEGRFKTGRYAMLYADEVVLAHTNEAEYQAFVQNPRNEALKDRIVTVHVPYNLRLSAEVRIYEKLVAHEAPAGLHLAPHAIEAAAMFAVLTRLEESRRPGVGRLQKLWLYDGRELPGLGPRDREDLLREFPREGMHGISPRYITNQLGRALVRAEGCLTVPAVLRALHDGLTQHPAVAAQDVEGYRNLLHEVAEDIARRVETAVYPQFVASFDDQLSSLWHSYLEALETYLGALRQQQPVPADAEHLLREIEEEVGVSEAQKRGFREEVSLRATALRQRGESLEMPAHPALRTALERHLFAELQSLVQRALQDPSPPEATLRRLEAVRGRLIHAGYCPVCADELLQRVGGPLPSRAV